MALNSNILAAAAVKQFLNNTSATQQDQSTNELNAEVVSEGESYIEMVHHCSSILLCQCQVLRH